MSDSHCSLEFEERLPDCQVRKRRHQHRIHLYKAKSRASARMREQPLNETHSLNQVCRGADARTPSAVLAIFCVLVMKMVVGS
jgi:hypothetical protein